jgi:hypothetical protein
MAGESLGGADIVFANERSADEATLMTGEGEAINHQWSKSSAFEGLFRKALAEAGASSRYFSIIRPLSELSVLKAFSGLGRHHHVVSSCNRNFAESAEDRGAWWCCRCPKCAFTALGLALFLPRGQVEAMMGGNPLNDPEMLSIYEALTGLSAAKPWECVGTRDESAAALFALGKRDGWAECLAVAVLGPRLDSVLGADTLRAALHSALTPEPASHVPDSYERALTALL